jgi:prophage regulatory protein
MTAPVAGRRTIRIRKVEAKTGLSAPTIWRHSAAGTFPRPIKISPGCSAWIEDEIDELIEAKRLARDAGVDASGVGLLPKVRR